MKRRNSLSYIKRALPCQWHIAVVFHVFQTAETVNLQFSLRV